VKIFSVCAGGRPGCQTRRRATLIADERGGKRLARGVQVAEQGERAFLPHGHHGLGVVRQHLDIRGEPDALLSDPEGDRTITETRVGRMASVLVRRNRTSGRDVQRLPHARPKPRDQILAPLGWLRAVRSRSNARKVARGHLQPGPCVRELLGRRPMARSRKFGTNGLGSRTYLPTHQARLLPPSDRWKRKTKPVRRRRTE